MKREEHRSIRLYSYYGFTVEKIAGNELIGRCVFCRKSLHFYANRLSGMWNCKHCGRFGSPVKFVELIAEKLQENIDDEKLEVLKHDRGIRKSTLRAWRVGYSPISGEYVFPITLPEGAYDLYRYRPQARNKMPASPGSSVGLAGAEALLSPKRAHEPVWICEGVWDAMSLYEVLRRLKIPGIVLALPGAETFKRGWENLLADRDVRCCLDYDDAGRRGSEHLQGALSGVAKRVRFLRWPSLPSFHVGFDIRDLYHQLVEPQAVMDFIEKHLSNSLPGDSLVEERSPIKQETAVAVAAVSSSAKKPKKEKTPIVSAEEVSSVFHKWLILPNDTALDIVLGTMFGNRLQGDPLWMFLVAPPGGSKSAILMALDGGPGVKAISSLTPKALISGAVGKHGADPSLLARLNEQVLVIKDFTTLLGLPQVARDEIFSTLRDAYDGIAERAYGEDVQRRYTCHFGLLAGVTPAVQLLTSVHSALGERFLRYQIRYLSSAAVEAETIHRAIGAIGTEDKMRESLADVTWRCLERDVDSSSPPKLPPEIEEKLVGLAQWVAMLRGTVDIDPYHGHLRYLPFSEIGTRLGKQLTKLAYGIAIYRQLPEVTPEIYQLVSQVAKDTVPDRVESLMRVLYSHNGGEIIDDATVAGESHIPASTAREVLSGMRMLKITAGREDEHYLRKNVRELMDNLELYEVRV